MKVLYKVEQNKNLLKYRSYESYKSKIYLF